MNRNANRKLTPLSQRLRRDMTAEEKRLWYDFLKSLPVNVYRQKVIGNYIADFYIAKPKIVIELDGSQHYSEEGMRYDSERNEFLRQRGIVVLRYTNLDIKRRFDAVCSDILNHLCPQVR